jgi:hypothetical protein
MKHTAADINLLLSALLTIILHYHNPGLARVLQIYILVCLETKGGLKI